MPKFGGHVSRMADFFEQVRINKKALNFLFVLIKLIAMIGSTENLTGAWQLVRKTGRLHSKIPFLEEFQNQLEKNYFSIIIDNFIHHLIPFLSGSQVF